MKKHSMASFLKFILPSALGVFLFMIPFNVGDKITIPVAQLSNWLQNQLNPVIPYILLGIITLTAIGTLFTKAIKPKFILNHKFLDTLFNVTPIWVVIRLLSAIFIFCAVFEVGPEFIYGSATGGLILNDLLPILFTIFLFAGLLLPLLLNFGLLEFVGALLVKIMRPLFKLPGRSAIDCMASWLGDGTIGVLLTSKQYEEGFYTEREACVIGTTFSLVSITFTLVIAETVGLSHMFIPFYLTVTLASLVAAIIVPKFGPLAKKKDVLYTGDTPKQTEALPQGYTAFTYGIDRALTKASTQSVATCVVKDGFKNVIDMWFAVIPVVMGVGTIALVIAEHTPVFQIIGLPFYPVLSILNIPEALAASSTLMAGFADMLLPSVLAAGVDATTGAYLIPDITRFVIACVSVSQLIYLSEVGALLLGSKIPVNLKELFIIFLQRTLVTLPVIALVAHILF